MKKISSFLALFLISIGMMAQTPLEYLAIHIPVTGHKLQTLNVVDANGKSIANAKATITAKRVTHADGTSVDISLIENGIADNLYVVDWNQKMHPGTKLVYNLEVKGLPAGVNFNTAELMVHAVNGAAYQGQQRLFGVKIEVGESVSTLNHKTQVVDFNATNKGGINLPLSFDTQKSVGNNVSIQITVTGKEGVGSFFGLSNVALKVSDMDKAAIDAYLASLKGNANNQFGWIQNTALLNTVAGLVENGTLKNVDQVKQFLEKNQFKFDPTEFYTIRNISNSWKGGIGNIHVSLDHNANITYFSMADFNATPMTKIMSLYEIEAVGESVFNQDGTITTDCYLKHRNTGLRVTLGANNVVTMTPEGSVVSITRTNVANRFSTIVCGGKYLIANNNKLEWANAFTDKKGLWLFENYTDGWVHLSSKPNLKSATTWSTLCLPFDAKIVKENKNIKEYVYGISAIGNGAVTLKQMDGIKANKGVILYKSSVETDKNGHASIHLLFGKYGGKIKEPGFKNLLNGTNVAFDSSADPNNEYYVLGFKEVSGNVVFGLYGSNSPVMKANKAYLALPKGTAVQGLKFCFDDVTTGVDQIEVNGPTEEADPVYYDLSGRRVMHPIHGIYIKNGKKVYFK